MGFEVTIKVKFETSEILTPLDGGLRSRIEEDILETIKEADLDFQSDNDVDIQCHGIEAEILDINQII